MPDRASPEVTIGSVRAQPSVVRVPGLKKEAAEVGMSETRCQGGRNHAKRKKKEALHICIGSLKSGEHQARCAGGSRVTLSLVICWEDSQDLHTATLMALKIYYSGRTQRGTSAEGRGVWGEVRSTGF